MSYQGTCVETCCCATGYCAAGSRLTNAAVAVRSLSFVFSWMATICSSPLPLPRLLQFPALRSIFHFLHARNIYTAHAYTFLTQTQPSFNIIHHIYLHIFLRERTPLPNICSTGSSSASSKFVALSRATQQKTSTSTSTTRSVRAGPISPAASTTSLGSLSSAAEAEMSGADSVRAKATISTPVSADNDRGAQKRRGSLASSASDLGVGSSRDSRDSTARGGSAPAGGVEARGGQGQGATTTQAQANAMASLTAAPISSTQSNIPEPSAAKGRVLSKQDSTSSSKSARSQQQQQGSASAQDGKKGRGMGRLLV